ncbi:hypothetical protein ACVWW1_007009 [Bradyrhizobium sp. JR3.5]
MERCVLQVEQLTSADADRSVREAPAHSRGGDQESAPLRARASWEVRATGARSRERFGGGVIGDLSENANR